MNSSLEEKFDYVLKNIIYSKKAKIFYWMKKIGSKISLIVGFLLAIVIVATTGNYVAGIIP